MNQSNRIKGDQTLKQIKCTCITLNEICNEILYLYVCSDKQRLPAQIFFARIKITYVIDYKSEFERRLYEIWMAE